MGWSHKGTIHVGASVGQEVEDYRRSGMRWCVLIEPLPAAFSQLKAAIGDSTTMIPVQALCSSHAGIEHDFYISNYGGLSSSILKPSRHLVEVPEVEFADPVKVVSTTIDDIVADLVKNTPGFSMGEIDLLTLDVQGAELLVLRGASMALQDVRYVCSEVSTGGLYDGDVRFYDLQAYLECYGFSLVNMSINKYGWGDAFFAKMP
jgi:FkbM family methyltransferase